MSLSEVRQWGGGCFHHAGFQSASVARQWRMPSWENHGLPSSSIIKFPLEALKTIGAKPGIRTTSWMVDDGYPWHSWWFRMVNNGWHPKKWPHLTQTHRDLQITRCTWNPICPLNWRSTGTIQAFSQPSDRTCPSKWGGRFLPVVSGLTNSPTEWWRREWAPSMGSTWQWRWRDVDRMPWFTIHLNLVWSITCTLTPIYYLGKL